MTVSVRYAVPEPAEGTVTITMPLPMAQKLMAMLGRTTGTHFDGLYGRMDDVLPAAGRVSLKLGESPRADSYGSLNINLHPASGASFTPLV